MTTSAMKGPNETSHVQWMEEEESGSSGHGTSEASGDVEQPDTKVKEVIAKRESKVVLFLKLAVLFVLVASALGVAVSTFRHVSGNESEQFRSKFDYEASKIFDSIGSNLDRTLGIFDSLSVTLVSSARDKGDKWPYVALADYGLRLSKLLPLSNSIVISLAPIVSPEQREKWEAYSLAHGDWVNQSLEVQQQWANYHGPINRDWEPYGVIFGDSGDIPYNETRDLLPLWQTFPTIPSAYPPFNWDYLSATNTGHVRSCIKQQQAFLSEPYMIPTPNDPEKQAETDAWASWFADYLPPNENPVEPVSDFYYPVVDKLPQDELDGDSDQGGGKTVAILSSNMYWREALKNILPEDSNGIDVVFKNPCKVAFTYRLNGPNTTFLGVDDLHERRYNHLEKAMNLTDLGRYSTAYSGLPLNKEYCPFTLHIYPSSVMEANHTTENRIIFTVSAVLIFAFTSLVFCLYDTTVEHRQKIVMRTAVRSSAIVSSLFPEDVRDRIYNAGQQEEGNAKGNLLSYVGSGKATQGLDANNEKAGVFSGDPIAELYPDTTVLFADIAGFTSWSSDRQPTQVFRLLESLYHAFDVIAKHRGVFKVETIGDSYVAVVGLPAPKDHHAVAMARFAKDIRAKMTEVVSELEESLGAGTADLALRIGLNSGPTTAGVLRGEKSRFQLFGDTVNTAARMESNGERNMIHVSQATADLLATSGKRHWLTPRAEKVHAKGKGTMQTFWCEPKAGGGYAESSISGGDGESSVASNDADDHETPDVLAKTDKFEDNESIEI